MNTLENEKFMERANNTVDVTILKSMGSSKFVSKPSIIFAKVGAAIFGEKKRITKYPFVTDNNMMSYSPTNRYDIEFVWNWFLRTSLSKSVQTSALPSLNITTLGALEMASPSSEEQGRIAKFLSLIDSRIATQRHLVELLKKHKRGVVEQLFGRRLTMGKPVAWTTRRLRDLFTKVARRNKNCAVKNVITNSAEHGLIPQRDFFDKDIAVDGNTGAYYVIRTGDFVYNPRKSTTAPFGPFNRYTGTDDGIISPLYTCLVPIGGADPEYLAWYFRSTAWHRYVYDNGSQGARHDRVNMTDDLLLGIPILLPDLQTQKRIANVLNELDAHCIAAQSVLEGLLDMKRGLLQQLFV